MAHSKNPPIRPSETLGPRQSTRTESQSVAPQGVASKEDTSHLPHWGNIPISANYGDMVARLNGHDAQLAELLEKTKQRSTLKLKLRAEKESAGAGRIKNKARQADSAGKNSSRKRTALAVIVDIDVAEYVAPKPAARKQTESSDHSNRTHMTSQGDVDVDLFSSEAAASSSTTRSSATGLNDSGLSLPGNSQPRNSQDEIDIELARIWKATFANENDRSDALSDTLAGLERSDATSTTSASVDEPARQSSPDQSSVGASQTSASPYTLTSKPDLSHFDADEQALILRAKEEMLETARRRADQIEAANAKVAKSEEVKAALISPEKTHKKEMRVAAKREMNLQEAKRQELARVEMARAEAQRAETKRIKRARDEAEHVEATRAEAARIEATRAEAAERVEALRAEATLVEAARLQVQQAEVDKARLKRYEERRTQVEKAQAARLELSRAEAARSDAYEAHATRLEVRQAEADEAAANQAKVETEATHLEVQRIEAEQAEVQRLELLREEAARVQAARMAELRTEAQKAESLRAKVKRAAAHRAKAQRAEAKRVQAAQATARKATTARAEAIEAEAKRAEISRAEHARAEAKRSEDRIKLQAKHITSVEIDRINAARIDSKIAAFDNLQTPSQKQQSVGVNEASVSAENQLFTPQLDDEVDVVWLDDTSQITTVDIVLPPNTGQSLREYDDWTDDTSALDETASSPLVVDDSKLFDESLAHLAGLQEDDFDDTAGNTIAASSYASNRRGWVVRTLVSFSKMLKSAVVKPAKWWRSRKNRK